MVHQICDIFLLIFLQNRYFASRYTIQKYNSIYKGYICFHVGFIDVSLWPGYGMTTPSSRNILRITCPLWNYHPFPIFNSAAVEVWEWITKFIPHFTKAILCEVNPLTKGTGMRSFDVFCVVSLNGIEQTVIFDAITPTRCHWNEIIMKK